MLRTKCAGDMMAQAARDLDVSAFLIKPVSLSALQDRLRSIFSVNLELKTPSTYRRVATPVVDGLAA